MLGLATYRGLLQEDLRGVEYVVDTVSRSGVHKCRNLSEIATWKGREASDLHPPQT